MIAKPEMIPSSKSAIWRLLFLPLVLLVTACGSPEQRSQEYYERGMALIAKGDDLNARLELLNAAKYKSDRVDVWRGLAGIDERTKAKSYFNDLRRIVELDPNDLDAKIKMARMILASGATEAASKVIENVKEGDKPNAALHALQALIYAKDNDVAGATREAQRTLEIDPANVDAILVLASKRLADGDPDGALKLLAAAAPDTKADFRLPILKVQIFAAKKDWPQVELVLQKLIKENPSQPAFRNQLIQAYIAGRQLDEAEKELRAIATANPADSKAGLDVVRFLNDTKGAAAAQAELTTRINAGGDVFDYQMALAELEFGQGKVDDATQELKTLAATAGSPDRKLEAQAKLAEFFVVKANYAAAEPIIADMLAKDRRNTAGLRLRAAIRIEQGQFDPAIADLREALNDQPKSPELLSLMALAYERSGKNELAERQYADALKASNFSPAVGLRYVSYLQRQGDLARTEDVLLEMSNANPRNLQVLSALAQTRLARKNWQGALAVADTMAGLGDDHGLADQVRASALAGENKMAESISALEAAHASAPDAVQPVVSLVSSYVRLGKPDKAEAVLKEMLKKYPDNGQLLVLLGQTKFSEKKADEALQLFKTAIAKQPKDPSAYSALAEIYIRQKNYDGATTAVQSGLQQQPDNANLRLTWAGLQILKGDQGAAIEQYQTILKQQPNSMVAINNLVSLILDADSDKESLKRALSLAERLRGSNVPQFEDTYGWAQYKQGDYKGALSTLEAAQSKMPDLAVIRYHLGMSYAALGQGDRAAEQFKAAFALEPDGTPLKDTIRAAMK